MDIRDRVKTTTSEAGSLLVNPRFVGPCIAGLFCLIVATVVGVSYLFTMASVLLALPVASYIVGITVLRGCSVTRDHAIIAEQGTENTVNIRLESTYGQLPGGLTVKDRTPRYIDPLTDDVVEPAAGRYTELKIGFIPRKRGRYNLGPVEMSCLDPLGMMRLRRSLQGTTQLVVHPRAIPFRLNRLLYEGREFESVHTTGRLAPSGDFAGVREYQQGDELRRVHWRTTARVQKLVVKELEDTTISPVTVVLDLSRGTDLGSGPLSSLDIAAGAVVYAIREYIDSGRPVNLVLARGSSIMNLDLRSRRDILDALDALADAQADSSVTISDLMGSVSRSAAVLLVTSAGKDDIVEAVAQAAARGIRVGVALVDTEPFGGPGWTASAADFEQAGAHVEIIRQGEESQ